MQILETKNYYNNNGYNIMSKDQESQTKLLYHKFITTHCPRHNSFLFKSTRISQNTMKSIITHTNKACMRTFICPEI